MFAVLLVPGLAAATAIRPYLPLDPEYAGSLLGVLAVLAVTLVMTRWVNRKPLGAVGLFVSQRTFRDAGTGFLLGAFMIAMVAGAQGASGTLSLTWLPPDMGTGLRITLLSFASFALAGFLEELLFRGYLFQTLMQAVTFLPAALILSAFFAVAHFSNPNTTTIGLVNVGLAGLWLSFAYLKTRNLWLPTGLHIGWNFSQTTLFGYPTSGIEFAGNRLVAQVQGGPAWLTGASFGAEGSVFATAVILGCTWYIVKSRHFAAPAGVVTLDSLEDLLGPANGEPEA